MRLIVAVILIVLQTEVTITRGDVKEHVHFKIHVPEIINHHIHTKTIFIRNQEPKKQTPKKYPHQEALYDDWNHYNDYNNVDNYVKREKDERWFFGGTDGHQAIRDGRWEHQNHNGARVTSHKNNGITRHLPSLENNNFHSHRYHPANPELSKLRYDHSGRNPQRDQELPVPPIISVLSNGLVGYSDPPRYDVRENVVEDLIEMTPESNRDSYERGQIKHRYSENGHLYRNELNDFYEDEHEESSEASSKESDETDGHEDHDSYGYVGDDYITMGISKR